MLHPRLAEDCTLITEWPLCSVLLMNDANYPWCILVPRRDGVEEIYQLADGDQQALMAESSRLARTLMTMFEGHSMNIAALGNVVPQLHVHHVVRYRHDAAWPAPVWGARPATPYSESLLRERVKQLQQAL